MIVAVLIPLNSGKIIMERSGRNITKRRIKAIVVIIIIIARGIV